MRRLTIVEPDRCCFHTKPGTTECTTGAAGGALARTVSDCDAPALVIGGTTNSTSTVAPSRTAPVGRRVMVPCWVSTLTSLSRLKIVAGEPVPRTTTVPATNCAATCTGVWPSSCTVSCSAKYVPNRDVATGVQVSSGELVSRRCGVSPREEGTPKVDAASPEVTTSGARSALRVAVMGAG